MPPCLIAALVAVLFASAGCSKDVTIPATVAPIDEHNQSNPINGLAEDNSDFPTLEDYWNGAAEFVVDVADTGLPMGESDTVKLEDGR